MQFNPSLKWNTTPKALERITKSYVTRSIRDVKDAVEVGAKAGANGTLDFKINAGTPTGSVWHYLTNVLVRSQDPGARRDTGTMASAVGSSKASGNVLLSASYGLPLNGPDYFFEQEYGYTFTTWSGVVRNVPGMADPRYNAQEKIDKAISRSLNKAMAQRGFFRGGSRASARFERAYQRGQEIGFGAAWRLEFPGPDSGNISNYLRSAADRSAQNIFKAQRINQTTYESILRQSGKAAADSFRARFERG